MTGDLRTLLAIDHPIVLGPFGGLSSVDLVASVSNAGGLGSYGLYGYTGDRILETAEAIRAATPRPFALNLWLPLDEQGGPGGQGDSGSQSPAGSAGFDEAAEALRDLYEEMGIPVPAAPPARYLPPLEEQWAAVLEVRPSAVSVVYGVPSPGMLEAARERGIAVIGTATTVAEAVALAEAGVDAIVATGFEAAGHRVSFLRRAEDSLVGSIALIPQVADAVPVPVVAAGGIADRRGVAAAFALGARGVQVGTAFLRTRQSAATEAHRSGIETASADGTVLTRAMSGRLARGIPNRAVGVIEARNAIAPFPVQNWLTSRFRAEAQRRDRGDLQSLWAGQSASLSSREDAADVFAELLAGIPR
jgi:nitronate monooxygenase